MCASEITVDTLYNGRPIHEILFDKTAQTICISEIAINGEKLIPERVMRRVHLSYNDFLKFHNNLENIILQYDSWQTPLRCSFTVKGGWAIPKAPLISAQLTVASLQNYARWFWRLTDDWVVSCLFTQNEANDVVMTTADTEYTGMCTMNVELSTKTLW